MAENGESAMDSNPEESLEAADSSPLFEQVSKAPGFLEKGCMPVSGWTCRLSYRGLVARISPCYSSLQARKRVPESLLCIGRDLGN